jgi:anti-sigma-K factor RskA
MAADSYITSGVLELYVAGVLPEDQAREVQAMAAANPQIQAEVEKLERIYREYGRVQAEFPSHLFDDILDRIEKTPEIPVVSEPPAVKKLPEKKVKPVKEIVGKREPVVRYISGAPAYLRPLLAAAIILLVLSAGFNLYQYNRRQTVEQQLAQLQQEKLAWQEELELADATHKTSLEMLSMYEDTNYMHVTMTGQSIAPKAMAMVFWNKKDKKVYLVPKNLPAPPAGKQYQLWAVNMEGKPVDAGMLPPEKTKSDALVQLKTIPEAQAFAISLEPMGGSETPTNNAVYVVGKI